MKNEMYLSVGKAATTLGISIDTLRRLERQGIISPRRSSGGWRIYTTREIKSVRKYREMRARSSR